eukprot:TRINITY_DN62703_c0_g1_i1.p1 TRINITY_DN62703_c0_g1~~TRINITY_DN62703_c0_g1_i1.p1  ORF type:complete len:124 (+),score=20.16 TRINITY_DN62703_c0_g1_i1:309-680(+)
MCREVLLISRSICAEANVYTKRAVSHLFGEQCLRDVWFSHGNDPCRPRSRVITLCLVQGNLNGSTRLFKAKVDVVKLYVNEDGKCDPIITMAAHGRSFSQQHQEAALSGSISLTTLYANCQWH